MAFQEYVTLSTKNLLPDICSPCVDVAHEYSLRSTCPGHGLELVEQSQAMPPSFASDEPELFNCDESMVIQIPDDRPPDRSHQMVVLRQSDYQGGSLPD